jgi:hypothetical protein
MRMRRIVKENFIIVSLKRGLLTKEQEVLCRHFLLFRKKLVKFGQLMQILVIAGWGLEMWFAFLDERAHAFLGIR